MRAMVIAILLACHAATPSSAEIDDRSVVYIYCQHGADREAGSGVVVDSNGHVLTSRHVVERFFELDGAPCEGAMGTQSNPEKMKPLRVKKLAQHMDAALVEFVPKDIDFIPVRYSETKAIEKGMLVEAYGYHPQNQDKPSLRQGSVANASVLSGSRLPLNMNTTNGMSGGPVFAEETLIGIIEQEGFDKEGQATDTRVVLASELPPDIRRHLGDPRELNRERILSAQLAQDDLCTQLLREQITALAPRFPTAARIANSLSAEHTNSLAETAEFWVTVTTGPAEWLDCRSGSMLQTLYFPMGMMVRPERDVQAGGKTRTVFVTEHGLRVVLDESAIKPITEDVGFVFADGDGAFKVCKHNDKNCSPFNEFRVSEHDKHWPFVSGYQSYLRTEHPDDLDRARTALADLYDYQSRQELDDPLIDRRDLSDPEMMEACRSRQATLFSFFEHDDPQYLFFHPVRYSMCSFFNGKVYNRYERMKIVTLESARERFSKLWAVNNVPTLSENVVTATKALLQVDKPFVRFVRCGEPPGLTLKGLEALAGFDTNGVKDNISEIISAEVASKHSVYRHFQISQAHSPVEVFKAAPLFNEIEVEIICGENEELVNAGSIIVDLAPIINDKPLEIRLLDMLNLMEEDYGEKVGLTDAEELRRNLREGIVFQICEFREYALWRTTIYKMMWRSPKVRQARDILKVDLNVLANHLTHLILANAFSTDVELRDSDNKRQGCKT